MASAARLGLQPIAIRSDVVHGPWISGQIKATFDAANRPRVSSSLGLGFCLPSEHKTLAATPAAFGWDDAESKGFDVLANLIKGNCCLLRDKYSAEQARIDGEMRPVSLLEGIKNRMTAATCKGDAISERFFENFKYFKATLSDLQWRVVRAVHASLLPQIYGDDFELHKERLMKKYKIKDFSPAVFAEFPRRWGKTYIAAMIEASAMDCIGGGSCVVGAYRPQSRFFLATVKSFFMQIPGAEQRVILDSKDEFVVQPCMHAEGIAGAVNGEHSRCVAHSGNADGSRGQTVARMWYDEASFVRAEHIMSNAFANMKLKNTVVIMISSPPTNHDNVFYMLTQFTEIFTVVTAHLLCDDCMEKKATECPHVILPKPFWITSGKRGDDIDDTMKALDPRRYATELLGTANNPNVPVFRREDLSRLKDLGAVTLSSKPSVVYLSMDCSGGGGQTQSDTAIIVACYDEQSRLVVTSCSCFCHLFVCACMCVNLFCVYVWIQWSTWTMRWAWMWLKKRCRPWRRRTRRPLCGSCNVREAGRADRTRIREGIGSARR